MCMHVKREILAWSSHGGVRASRRVQQFSGLFRFPGRRHTSITAARLRGLDGTAVEASSGSLSRREEEVYEMKKTLIALAVAAVVAAPLGAWAADKEGK